jgi:hypothetical protein
VEREEVEREEWSVKREEMENPFKSLKSLMKIIYS